jgi:hypothetical protein
MARFSLVFVPRKTESSVPLLCSRVTTSTSPTGQREKILFGKFLYQTWCGLVVMLITLTKKGAIWDSDLIGGNYPGDGLKFLSGVDNIVGCMIQASESLCCLIPAIDVIFVS